MQIIFQKYHGTGNDFIMLDNRKGIYNHLTNSDIKFLCDRHFGIGADGLILLENSNKFDFNMRYYNADGREGSMCGNGGRCTVHFAKQLGLIDTTTTFEAVDGLHFATIEDESIALKMNDVHQVDVFENHCFLNTGSPHHIEWVDEIDDFPVFEIGKKKRYGAPYFEQGSNINFVELSSENQCKLRTYERGVENETLSCGTGATATAIALYETGKSKVNCISIEVLGGKLEVSFDKIDGIYTNVFLKGSATFVFEGGIII